jgi:hypothetical protein
MNTIITASEIDGKTYYTATLRGVEYCASQIGGEWFVSSRRLGLGRRHIGGGKYYKDLSAVSAGCKAFSGIDVLLECEIIA